MFSHSKLSPCRRLWIAALLIALQPGNMPCSAQGAAEHVVPPPAPSSRSPRAVYPVNPFDQAPPPGTVAGANSGGPVRLAGFVSARSIDTEMGDRIDTLVRTALARRQLASHIDQDVARYSTTAARSRCGAKDVSLNYLGLPRGFDASIQGAKVVLNQDGPAKSIEHARFKQQSELDTLHVRAVTDVLQMALGLGHHDETRGAQSLNKGYDDLKDLVGADEAAYTLQTIARWRLHTNVPESTFQSDAQWDVTEFRGKLDRVCNLSLRYDLEMIKVKDKLGIYANRSRGAQVSGKIVEGTVTGITIAGLGVGVSLAAQAAGAAWGIANGGSEESKLLRELYFEKQLQSRREVVFEEATLALMNYQQALQSGNASLLITSEALLAQLIGAVGIPQIIDHPVVDHGTYINHPVSAVNSK